MGIPRIMARFQRKQRAQTESHRPVSTEELASDLQPHLTAMSQALARETLPQSHGPTKFPEGSTITTELFGVVNEPVPHLLTLAIEPTWAPLLPIRLMCHDSLAGQVLTTGAPAFKLFPEQIISSTTEDHSEVAVERESRPGSPAAKEPHIPDHNATKRNSPEEASSRETAGMPRLRSTRAVAIIPLRKNQQIVGVVQIEWPTYHATIVQLDRIKYIVKRYEAKISAILAARYQDIAQAAETTTWLRAVANRQQYILFPRDVTIVYDQILQVALRIPHNAFRAEIPIFASALLLIRAGEQLENIVIPTNVDLTDPQLHTLRVVLMQKLGKDCEPPDPQWFLYPEHTDLNAKTKTFPSITSKVILTNQSHLAINVREDGYYLDAGASLANGTECNVPLRSDGYIVGALSVLNPQSNSINSTDASHLEYFATSVAQLVWRASIVSRARRSELQLDRINDLMRLITPPAVWRSHEEASKAHDQVLHHLCEWAAEYTNVRIAVLAVIQQRDHREVFRLLYYTLEPKVEYRNFLEVNDGLIGHVYREKRYKLVNDLETYRQRNEPYVEAYDGIRSEMAVPLMRGTKLLGVLNLESKELFHFTITHRRWAEFLAQQAVVALSVLDHAQRQLHDEALVKLTSLVAEHLGKMRQVNLDEIDRYIPVNEYPIRDDPDFRNLLESYLDNARQNSTHAMDLKLQILLILIKPMRDKILRDLLLETKRLTEAEIVSLRLFANQIIDHDEVRSGDLVLIYSTLPTFLTSSVDTVDILPFQEIHFKNDILKGLLHVDSIRTGNAEHFGATQPQTRSQLIAPLLEGTECVGTLHLESSQEYFFNHIDPMNSDDDLNEDLLRQKVASQIGLLAANVITATDFLTHDLQLQLLRSFERDCIALPNIDDTDYFSLVLRGAHAMTSVKNGWARIDLLTGEGDAVIRRYYLRINQYYTSHKIHCQVEAFENTPLLISNPIIKQAIHSREAVLELDYSHNVQANDADFQAVRSVLCVPLTLSNNASSENSVVGVLTVAALETKAVSDADKRILPLFAQTVMIGYQNLMNQIGRVQYMREVEEIYEHIAQTIGTMRQVRHHLAAANEMPAIHNMREEVRKALDATTNIDNMLLLAKKLFLWLPYLVQQQFDDSLNTVDSPTHSVTRSGGDTKSRYRARPLRDLAHLFAIYASLDSAHSCVVYWDDELPDVAFTFDDTTIFMVEAVLFGCLMHCLREGTMNIEISHRLDGQHVIVLQMKYSPQRLQNPATPFWISSLDRRYRGIPLEHLGRVAHRFGGKVEYEPVKERSGIAQDRQADFDDRGYALIRIKIPIMHEE